MDEPVHPPNIKSTWWRFLVIILAAFLLFGNMYAFDNPQALEDSLETELNLSEVQFNLLYAYFSLPNIATCLIIGVIIDKIGVKYIFMLYLESQWSYCPLELRSANCSLVSV